MKKQTVVMFQQRAYNSIIIWTIWLLRDMKLSIMVAVLVSCTWKVQLAFLGLEGLVDGPYQWLRLVHPGTEMPGHQPPPVERETFNTRYLERFIFCQQGKMSFDNYRFSNKGHLNPHSLGIGVWWTSVINNTLCCNALPMKYLIG